MCNNACHCNKYNTKIVLVMCYITALQQDVVRDCNGVTIGMRYSQHRVGPRTNQRNKVFARWEMDGGRLLLPLSIVVLVQTRG